MRRTLLILSMAALMTGTQPAAAQAAFESGHLLQVIYAKVTDAGGVVTGGNEVVTDLGATADLAAQLESLGAESLALTGNGTSAGSFSMDMFTEGADGWGDLQLAFFASSEDGFWFATTASVAPALGGTADFDGAAQYIYDYYAAIAADDNPVVGETEHYQAGVPLPPPFGFYGNGSYYMSMNDGYTTGTYAGLLEDPLGETDLAGLDSGEAVALYLWSLGQNEPAGILTLSADGAGNVSTILENLPLTPVPLPGAFVFMASLLAGVGLGRGVKRRSASRTGEI